MHPNPQLVAAGCQLGSASHTTQRPPAGNQAAYQVVDNTGGLAAAVAAVAVGVLLPVSVPCRHMNALGDPWELFAFWRFF